MPADCGRLRPKLLDLMEGALPGAAAQELRLHLGECRECAAEFRHLEKSWRELPEPVTPHLPADVRERVRAYAHDAAGRGASRAVPRRVSRRGQWIAVTGIITALAASLAVAVLLSPEIGRLVPGSDAPSFEAIDVSSGATLSLADFEGEVVLLNIWATWCAPCEQEMPSMEQLHRELGPAGLRVVAVSIDRESQHKVRQWAEERGFTFTILQDRSGRIEQAYQTTGVPESFVIDRNGVILKREIGPRKWDTPVQSALLRRLLDVGG